MLKTFALNLLSWVLKYALSSFYKKGKLHLLRYKLSLFGGISPHLRPTNIYKSHTNSSDPFKSELKVIYIFTSMYWYIH